jgi:Type II secretory pathway, component PulK
MIYNKITQKESGLILVVVLWILLILTIFALSVARSVRLDLLISRYGIDKLKSYYLAKTAVLAATARLNKDSQNEQASAFDTLYQCGVSLEKDESPEDVFKDFKQPGGNFSVSFVLPGGKIIYGLEDEQARINLNGINTQNYKVLISFLKLKGVDEETAKIIASSVVDWRDINSIVTNPPFGAEEKLLLFA